MPTIKRIHLFSKLSSAAYRAMESATGFSQLRHHAYVEIAHWFHQLLQDDEQELIATLMALDINESALRNDIDRYLERLPVKEGIRTDIASHVELCLEDAWKYASLIWEAQHVYVAHVIYALLANRQLCHYLEEMSSQFQHASVDQLAELIPSLLCGSEETQSSGTGGRHTTDQSSGEAIDNYCTDITEQARQHRLDPIVGRDDEIRQMIDILMRRRQNNPLLVGEAGVGKTAVIEGFAHRIVRGDVPEPLQPVRILSLDVGLLLAGASMKGEFEKRLKQLIEEVSGATQPTLLFIDETHTLVGAGGNTGTGDAANLLKPALARGELRTIGATTWSEYKKHIEKDPALTRRFQVVLVEEPDEPRAVNMISHITPTLEKHHRVSILDEAVEAAVRLSHRYIPGRQLPDKAVSLLDTAAARVTISQVATPARIDVCQAKIHDLDTRIKRLVHETEQGKEHQDIIQTLNEEIDILTTELSGLTARWHQEKELFSQAQRSRRQLETDSVQAEQHRGELIAVETKLQILQGDSPFILPECDANAVASVVEDWTGIPVSNMVKDDINNVLSLSDTLNQRIIGQNHSMEMIARRVQTARAGFDDPGKPVGVFMLCGTSGVGKTETALALAEALYGGEQNLITINMSEFQESHTVSTLKGSPPGYVGYGEGGILTEAVRRRPYSVILLDEVEKAHSDVHELFFQVFDKGVMEDGEGRKIDFKNTLILLTSNVGSELIMSMCNQSDKPEIDELTKALENPLQKVFPPALLGRLITIPYYPLDEFMLREIAVLQLERIKSRVAKQQRITLSYSHLLVDYIVARCTDREAGGRMINAIITNTLLPDISRYYLSQLGNDHEVHAVDVTIEEGQLSYRFS